MLRASCSAVEADGSCSQLSLLPRDVLLRIFRALEPRAILADLGATCHELCTIATSDDLWRLLVHERFKVVIEYAFDGVCPPPLRELSWRAHYYDFSATWMLRAREAGHVIMIIAGHVYDATDYVDDHPGMPAFLRSAAGTDATATFNLAGHSANAHQILRRFAVPILDPFLPPMRGAAVGTSASARRGTACSEVDVTARRRGPSDGFGHPSPASWRGVLDVLRVLVCSSEGRRQLVHSMGSLLHAAAVDMERTGRDPKGGEARTIQRYLPVAWRVANDELYALSRLLR